MGDTGLARPCPRKHVATLMKKMGIEALYRKPNTSKKRPQHAVYPYLLRMLKIERASHVWAMDITYIAMVRGRVYLAAAAESWLELELILTGQAVNHTLSHVSRIEGHG